MILTSIIITVLYLVLIGSLAYGFDRVKSFNLSDILSKTKFSIVIPFRNEAGNLPDLLHSISNLVYPKHLFEIIFVDDASEDHSADLINNFKLTNSAVEIKLIKNNRLTNAPKKDAIAHAIQEAKHDWIMTTDADCILPKYWLSGFDEYIQKSNAKCVVGPLTYSINNSLLERFQILDILSLQAATAGGFGIQKPFLCNGANFAYKKELFHKLNGFKGNTNISSGDDIFFLEKTVKYYPEQINTKLDDQNIT